MRARTRDRTRDLNPDPPCRQPQKNDSVLSLTCTHHYYFFLFAGLAQIITPPNKLNMTSLPYASFVTEKPVDSTQNRLGLTAAGKCRIDPEALFSADYREVVAKNCEQALVDTDSGDADEEQKKKLKKKFMKHGVAMGKKFLTETLQIDVSVVDVECVVTPKDLISTDGCLAACLLDAGCHAVVTDGFNLEAMDAAKIPRERLVANFKYSSLKAGDDVEAFTRAAALASCVSVEIDDEADANMATIAAIFKSAERLEDLECSVQIKPTMSDKELEALIKGIHAGTPTGRVMLVDPSPSQLGLAYSACIRTDRPDGLYTTVVCTRNGEALGLVYSSKVSQIFSCILDFFFIVFSLSVVKFLCYDQNLLFT